MIGSLPPGQRPIARGNQWLKASSPWCHLLEPFLMIPHESSDLIWLFLPPSKYSPSLNQFPVLHNRGYLLQGFAMLPVNVSPQGSERRRDGKWEGWDRVTGQEGGQVLEWLWFLHPAFLSLLSHLSLHSYLPLVSYQALWQLKCGLAWPEKA